MVVGQLQLLERDQLPHPVGPCGRRVWVDIKPPRHGWLSLPCDHPADKADSGRQLSSLGSGEAKLPIPPPPEQTKAQCRGRRWELRGGVSASQLLPSLGDEGRWQH